METDLGYRKVQCFGKGSLVISLPKEWADKIGITRGNEITFKVQSDSSLLLIPRRINEARITGEKSDKKEHYVMVEETNSSQSITRKISALYVAGTDLIHIYFKKGGIYLKHKAAINELIRNVLLGSEIVEESDEEMTIETLVSNSEFPIEKAISRMASLALSMSRDIILSLKKMDQNMLQGVLETHQDIKRLDLYVVRQLKFGIERNLLGELGFNSPKEFLGYRIVTNNIKSIADDAINVANDIVALNRRTGIQVGFLQEPIHDELWSRILDFSSLAQKSLEISLTALLEHNYERAEKNLSNMDQLGNIENDITNQFFTTKLSLHVLSIVRIVVANSKRIAECSMNIAEVALNRTVEQICSVKP